MVVVTDDAIVKQTLLPQNGQTRDFMIFIVDSWSVNDHRRFLLWRIWYRHQWISIWIKELLRFELEYVYTCAREQSRKVIKIEDSSLLGVGILLVKHHLLTHPVVCKGSVPWSGYLVMLMQIIQTSEIKITWSNYVNM